MQWATNKEQFQISFLLNGKQLKYLVLHNVRLFILYSDPNYKNQCFEKRNTCTESIVDFENLTPTKRLHLPYYFFL